MRSTAALQEPGATATRRRRAVDGIKHARRYKRSVPIRRVAQAVRVATAGETLAARAAGPHTASWPSTNTTSAPIGR